MADQFDIEVPLKVKEEVAPAVFSGRKGVSMEEKRAELVSTLLSSLEDHDPGLPPRYLFDEELVK